MARRKKGDPSPSPRAPIDSIPRAVGSAGGGPWYFSRGALLAAFALIFLLVVTAYASPARLIGVLSLFFTDGLLAVLWVLCAASLGSFLLCLFKLSTSPIHAGGGAERRTGSSSAHAALDFVTACALGLGVFSLIALGLGLAGWLNTVTTAAMLIASACLNPKSKLDFIKKLRNQPAAPWFAAPAGWHWLWLAVAPVVAMVLVGASLVPGLLWRPDDPHPYDVLEYHLQLPREWFELGRIVPLKHNVFSFFPLNAEMQSLLAMHLRRGPFTGMYLAQFIQTACMALAVVGVYGIVRRLRPKDHAGYAILAAVALAAVPWTMMLASVAYDESALLLYGTAAIGWALVALRESPNRARRFAVAGLFAGLACGVKYTAAPFLLVGIPVAMSAASILSKFRCKPTPESADAPSPGRVVGYGAIFVAAGLLTFSPWLVKNVAWARNPVFPLAMRVLGRAHFSEAKVKRFEIAHLPTAKQEGFAGHAKAAWDELIVHWEFGYFLWPVALVAIGLAARRREVWFLAFLLLAIFVTWVGFTHLLSRFFVIAMPVAALLIGSLPCRKSLAAGVITVLLMGVIGWSGLPGSAGGVNRRLTYYCVTMGQNGLFGLDEPGVWLVPDELDERDAGGSVQLVKFQPLLADTSLQFSLIGNAQPFAYSSIPMSRLTYRTVFDVDGEAGYPDAWLPPDQRGPRGDRILVVHPDEVVRLADTYYAVPHLPSGWPKGLMRPFLERR